MNIVTFRKILVFVLCLSVFSLLYGSVLAQISTTTNKQIRDQKREDIKTKIEEKKEDVKAQVAEKRAEVKEKRETLSKEIKNRLRARIKGFTQQIEHRLGAAIERMEKISERIDSRIQKMKAEAYNTTEAEGYLASMKTDIAEAKVFVGKIPAAIQESLTSDEIRGAFESVKELIEGTKKEIQSAHENAKKAIRNLMELVKESKEHASTTSSSN